MAQAAETSAAKGLWRAIAVLCLVFLWGCEPMSQRLPLTYPQADVPTTPTTTSAPRWLIPIGGWRISKAGKWPTG